MKMYLRPNGLLKHRTSKTAALHRALKASVKRTKANKYGAKKTQIDGVEFASKAEANRYWELKLLRAAGEIVGLELQPNYLLIVNGHQVGSYTPDFYYIEKGQMVADEVKGFKARDFPLRSKLFMALYPAIELRVNGKPAKRPKSLQQDEKAE